MRSINAVLRNLLVMIKSDEWGRRIFCRMAFHVASIISSMVKMASSKHKVATAKEISLNSFHISTRAFEAGRYNVVFETIIYYIYKKI